MTLICEVCSRTADQPSRYFIHLAIAHQTGELARAVEPTLFGTATISEAPPSHPRVWDRWDRGGRSGPAIRFSL